MQNLKSIIVYDSSSEVTPQASQIYFYEKMAINVTDCCRVHYFIGEIFINLCQKYSQHIILPGYFPYTNIQLSRQSVDVLETLNLLFCQNQRER